MKRVLLLTIGALLISSTAFADFFGIFSDATGQVCNISSGFSTTATILEKFSAGSTGSRFKMDLSLCPGTAFYSFNTPFVPIGVLTSDLSLAYGQCLTGDIVLGTIIAVWAPGAVSIVAADNFATIIYTDCSFGEYAATGGHTSIDGDGHGCNEDPVRNTTWSGVKALYR
ncbi:MAG TPA: hypothetical protein VFH88_02700 [Candidatus Krumholzibacteria bacterium]|nr:hypothetical protein [Candidatus Krumholzibacteria bacterium]